MLTEFRIGQLEETVNKMIWRVAMLETNESSLKETIEKLKKGINPLVDDGLRERIERLEEKIDRLMRNNSELEDRIRKLGEKKICSLGSLALGECFEWQGKIWMKIEPLDSDSDQAVCLENGKIDSFLKNWEVKCVEKGNFN